MRAAIWARVSTTDQETANQVRQLEAFARHHNYEVVQVYEVKASAYTGGHRQDIQGLLADAHRGQFDILLVWSLDRLSREGVRALFGIMDDLAQRGVKVISLQEAWTNVPGEMYELLLSITAWVAQWTSTQASRRIRAGVDRRRAEGKSMGRPRSDVTPQQARAAMKEHGSRPKAAEALNISEGTLRRRLLEGKGK